ncbi:MAG: hypothetical protein AAB402_02940 [Patescibacteria group bacterium]
MPFLPKVVRAENEKPRLIQKPLSDVVYRALETFSRAQPTVVDSSVATIEVHDTISNVAWAYEKLRQAIDYQDEHLLRKNAIERILKRRLVAGVTADTVAEPLILELISGRYLLNKTLPVTIIAQAAEVLNRYVHLWTQVPHLPHQEAGKLFAWYLGILAVELNELLAPADHDEALLQLMYRVTHRDIAFAEEHLTEDEKNTQLYIAIHRALLKSDPSIIRFHLFIRRHPTWPQATADDIVRFGRELSTIRTTIESQLFHPAGELLQRLMKKYTVIFLVFDDLAKRYGAEAGQRMAFPDELVNDIKQAYANRRKVVLRKITRNIIRSIIYVFLTKMLLLVLIEIPVERILYSEVTGRLLPLIINVAFPPFLLFFLGVTIRPAGKKNEIGVIENVEALVYRGDERNVLVKPRKPLRRSAFFTGLFRFTYALTFIAVFGGIVWGLTRLHFTPISTVIFLLFLSIVSFFGIRVRLLSKELLVVDQRENIFTVLFDFLTVPILQVGRWISLRVPKINVMIFFLDVIIEAPFKAFLEATEGFFGFLKEKREEIY